MQRCGQPIGTNQSAWKLGLPKGIAASNLCTNTTVPAVSAYAHIVPTAISASVAGEGADSLGAAIPVATDFDTGVFPIQVPELSNRMNFKFYLGDANNETAEAYVFGLKRLTSGKITEWIGDYLGALAITAGAKAVNASSLIVPADAGAVFWADIILPTDDSYNDSWEVFSNTSDGAAVASVDSFGYEWLIVVPVVGGALTAESVGFIWNEI